MVKAKTGLVSLRKIFIDIEEKMPRREILKKYDICDRELFYFKKEYRDYKNFLKKDFARVMNIKIQTPPVSFGVKNESYYSEEEMLKGATQLIIENLNNSLGQAL
jgi:hypothetical protein